MVSLAICTVLCSMISIVMRLGRNRVSSTLNMMAVNYVTCILVAGALMGFDNPLPQTDGLGLALGMGLVNGFLYVASFLLLQYNIQKSGVVLASVYSRISLIVPLIGSIFLYHEIPTVCQWIGFAVCAVASVTMNEKDGSGGRFSLALPLLLLTDGAASITSKIFNEAGNPALSTNFLFYTFFAALLYCVVASIAQRQRPNGWDLLYGVLLGLPNYFTSHFLLKALSEVPAVVVYPTRGVASIALIALAGVLLFKERLSMRQWISIFAIAAALVLLNL